MLKVHVERTFSVPLWDEDIKQKALDFWVRRGVTFSETSAHALTGKRGNLVGNLASFDMSKLIAQVTITVSPPNEVRCVLDVNTVMQSITEHNKAWWDLELQTFESFLLRGDEQEEKWKTFQGHYKKAAWTWSFTAGLGGNRMSPAEKP